MLVLIKHSFQHFSFRPVKVIELAGTSNIGFHFLFCSPILRSSLPLFNFNQFRFIFKSSFWERIQKARIFHEIEPNFEQCKLCRADIWHWHSYSSQLHTSSRFPDRAIIKFNIYLIYMFAKDK